MPIVSPTDSMEVVPLNQTLIRSVNATFHCTAQGGPNTIYRWIRGSNPLSPITPPVDVTSVLSNLNIVGNESRLVLESIVGDDGGEYTCIAINEAGFDNDTVTLFISPSITRQPLNQYVQSGDTVTLYCEADSFPSPTYQWLKKIVKNEMFQSIVGAVSPNYTIQNVIYEDFGYYECKVTTPIINKVAYSDAIAIFGKYTNYFQIIIFL